MGLRELQTEHRHWVDHNFPDQRDKGHEPLLGLAEEVGELAHAHLKRDQGIRGYDHAQYVLEAGDAVGDIFVYLMSYCNANDLDLETIVHSVWGSVKERDWIKYPQDGRTK